MSENLVSRDMMMEIYSKKHDQTAQLQLLDSIMDDTSVSNQEILNQLGKLTDEQRLLKLHGEVSGITLTAESAMLGNNALVLSLPKRWILGSQYCSHAYQDKLHHFGAICSMSGKGDCYD